MAHQISTTLFNELITKVLACPLISDPTTRSITVQILPDKIRNAVNNGPITNARLHVGLILRTCFNYPGGWATLLEMIEFYEDGSIPSSSLQEFVNRNGLHHLDGVEIVGTSNAAVTENSSQFISSPGQLFTLVEEGNSGNLTTDDYNTVATLLSKYNNVSVNQIQIIKIPSQREK